MKALLVDDNAQVRKVIRSMIADLAEVVECEDGAQAAMCYQIHDPTIVFMDIRMSHVNGIEATRRIMALDSTARVVIVSNYDDDKLRSAAREAGACDYILKDDLFRLRGIIQGIPGPAQTP